MAAFPPEVKAVCPNIVSCTVDIYQRVSLSLLPTPSKFHYNFNQRDIVRVMQGIMTISPVKCASSEAATRLWAHEMMRVFHDRLVTAEDTAWFQSLLSDTLLRTFRVSSVEPVRRCRNSTTE